MNPKGRRITWIYLIYLGILLVIMSIFLLYARKSLILYEAAQPTVVMDQLLSKLAVSVSDNLTDTTVTNQASEFEPISDYLETIQKHIQAGDVTYQKIHEDYTDGSLTYALSSSDGIWGEAVITPQNTTSRMRVLTLSDYVLTSFVLTAPEETYSVNLSLPSEYSLSINGIAVSKDYLVEEMVDPALTYCSEYIEVPVTSTYVIEGLRYQPQVTIYGVDGMPIVENMVLGDSNQTSDCIEVSANSVSDQTMFSMKVNYQRTEPPADVREYVLASVETYSNFFSKDLPGSTESIDPIRYLFPEDSIYLTLAEQYRREDMGVFSSHSNTHFLNEVVSNYTVYSANCYSVHVTFDKSMTLGSGKEVIDTTDNIYYFIYVGDCWVIADIQ